MRELTRAVGHLAALQQNRTMSSERSCQNLVKDNELCHLNNLLLDEEYYSSWIQIKIQTVSDQDVLIVIIKNLGTKETMAQYTYTKNTGRKNVFVAKCHKLNKALVKLASKILNDEEAVSCDFH